MLLQEPEPAGGGGEGGEIWQDTEEQLREQAARLSSNLALSHQENRELQERLMVSEATVHAQAEQLKDYRELLSERGIGGERLGHQSKTHQRKGFKCSSPLCAAETSVQQASKQVQVDLQDLGYETCGRSENEAEREDASSPGNTLLRSFIAGCRGAPSVCPLPLPQTLMTWRCARRCHSSRTTRPTVVAGTPATAEASRLTSIIWWRTCALS